MHWDGTIRLGDLLVMLTIAGAVIGVYVSIRERLIRIETQLAPLWTAYVADHGVRPIERRQTKRRAADRV